MVPVLGWHATEVIASEGLHPESNHSTVLNTVGEYSKENEVFITLMLWKKSGEKWTKKSLVPLKAFEMTHDQVRVRLHSGEIKTLRWDE